MDPTHVPAALREQLGEEASSALVEMIHASIRASIESAVDRATDRFERRLTEILDRATDRFERRLAEELAKLRVELRTELAATRAELLKWSFMFWTGQIVAIAALLALMLRTTVAP